MRGPATRRRPERTGAPSSHQRRARIPSASPQPRDPAASRPQGTRGGASGAVTADASRASTRDRGSRTARRHARRFPAGVLGSHCPVSTTRPEGDVCPALPRSPGQPGTAARAPLLLLGRSGDAVVPRLAGVQLGRGQAHGVQRTRRQLLRLRGGLPHTCRSHVSRPRCGSLPLCRGTQACPRSLLAGDPKRPSRCPLGVPSCSPPPASTLPFYAGCPCELWTRDMSLASDPKVLGSSRDKDWSIVQRGNTGPNRLKPVKTRTTTRSVYT